MRLACPNRRFMNSRPMRPNDPTMAPASREDLSKERGYGVGDCVREERESERPEKAKTTIITGKSANQNPQKTVEWIRHSSFIMARKRSGTNIAPH